MRCGPIRTLFIAAGFLLVGAQVASADDDAGRENNVVAVVNRLDGKTRDKSHLAIVEDGDGTILEQNVAFAHASCTDCRTVAVAVQVVIVIGSPPDFRPLNAAIAQNEL